MKFFTDLRSLVCKRLAVGRLLASYAQGLAEKEDQPKNICDPY
jgi:hypothetical protein